MRWSPSSTWRGKFRAVDDLGGTHARRRRAPFGHGKAEYFFRLRGLLILGAAVAIIFTAVDRLLNPQPLEALDIGLAFSLVSTMINFGVAQTLRRAAVRHRSIALEADARHLMTDVWTSVGVVLGLAAVALTDWLWLDPLIAIAVGLNILREALHLVRGATDGLMDRAIPAEEEQALRQVLDGLPTNRSATPTCVPGLRGINASLRSTCVSPTTGRSAGPTTWPTGSRPPYARGFKASNWSPMWSQTLRPRFGQTGCGEGLVRKRAARVESAASQPGKNAMFAAARPIYRVDEIRRIEAAFLDSAEPPLMERAGEAAAELAAELIGKDRRAILVVCGPGNNGGDALVLARLLRAAGRAVCVVLAGDAGRLPADAAKAHAAWLDAGGGCERTSSVSNRRLEPGGGRALRHRPAATARRSSGHLDRASQQPRCAPPGAGHSKWPRGRFRRVLGCAFDATHTITFIALKPGLLTLDGPDHCGRIHLAPIGIDAEASLPANAHEITPAIFSSCLARRRRNSHKGSYGDVVVIGGDKGMTGAALLAGRAALHLGAGRVFVCLLAGEAMQVDPIQPELMLRSADEALCLGGIAVAGPGLGRSPQAHSLLAALLESAPALLLDADALNLVAARPALAQSLRARQVPAIITPHPAEAARLLGADTARVQADRVAAGKALAARFNCIALLKGCGSIVASPDGRWWINRSGHPGMASAGMGDVLSGITGALLAQHWPGDLALIGATHLHGRAAEQLTVEGIGPVGLLAGELPGAARRVLNAWLAGDEPAPGPQPECIEAAPAHTMQPSRWPAAQGSRGIACRP